MTTTTLTIGQTIPVAELAKFIRGLPDNLKMDIPTGKLVLTFNHTTAMLRGDSFDTSYTLTLQAGDVWQVIEVTGQSLSLGQTLTAQALVNYLCTLPVTSLIDYDEVDFSRAIPCPRLMTYLLNTVPVGARLDIEDGLVGVKRVTLDDWRVTYLYANKCKDS